MIPSCLQCSDSTGNARKGSWATVCPGDSQDGERSRHLIMKRREDSCGCFFVRKVGLLRKSDYTLSLWLPGGMGMCVWVCRSVSAVRFCQLFVMMLWLHMCFWFFFKFFSFFFFIYLFMAVLGLRFCARAFSRCGKRGPLFIAVRGPLTIAASLVAEHRLQTRRLSSCGSRA